MKCHLIRFPFCWRCFEWSMENYVEVFVMNLITCKNVFWKWNLISVWSVWFPWNRPFCAGLFLTYEQLSYHVITTQQCRALSITGSFLCLKGHQAMNVQSFKADCPTQRTSSTLSGHENWVFSCVWKTTFSDTFLRLRLNKSSFSLGKQLKSENWSNEFCEWP